MNWRRGLFRLWIVGAALFVIAVAAISYSDIKAEFDAAREARESSILARDASFADEVYKRFYGDMPREQFDKKIAAAKPVIEPSALEAILAQLDTSRPLSQWSDDELVAYAFSKDQERLSEPFPWFTLGTWAGIASGVPLAVLVLGASLVWAFSGFATAPKQ
jgi:hypothetical protein